MWRYPILVRREVAYSQFRKFWHGLISAPLEQTGNIGALKVKHALIFTFLGPMGERRKPRVAAAKDAN